MFLAHNQPFLNFDHLVDVNGLLAIKPYVSAFIAKNHHLLKPTKFYGNLFKDHSLGTHDYQDKFEVAPDTMLILSYNKSLLILLHVINLPTTLCLNKMSQHVHLL